MAVIVNRAPVLTLWAAVVAEQLGHPPDTALTLGRAVAGSAARVKARSIGREERKADRDADTPRLRVTAPVFLLGKTIRLLPNNDGELRAADGDQPADPVGVERYLTKAFGDHLADVRSAMQALAARYEPAELNRIGFKLYEKFRPEIPWATTVEVRSRVIRYKNSVDVDMRIPRLAWLFWGGMRRIKRRLVLHIDAAKDICIHED